MTRQAKKIKNFKPGDTHVINKAVAETHWKGTGPDALVRLLYVDGTYSDWLPVESSLDVPEN